MRAHSVTLIVLFAVYLTGCTSAGMSDVGAKKQDKEMATETANGFASIDDARCRSFGYQPGTATYAQCRSDYEKLHKQEAPE